MGIMNDQKRIGNIKRDKKIEIYFTNKDYKHFKDITKKLGA